MIERILPTGTAVVEAFDDTVPVTLFPEEEALMRRAVDKRRREFSTARRCAREALTILGHSPAPLLPDGRGAPMWPTGVVGSITHCVDYRAAAVANCRTIGALGLDAEPNEPLPEGVLPVVALPSEQEAVRRLLDVAPRVRWDRLLFCAKEAVYKAWYPLTGRWLGFEDAEINIDPDAGGFAARILVDAAVDGRPLTGFTGRYLVERNLLVTAIAVPPPSLG